MRSLSKFLTRIGSSVLFWTLAFVIYVTFRFLGLDSAPGVTINEGLNDHLFFIRPLVIFIVIGAFLGVLYGLIDLVFERYLLRKFSLGGGVILKVWAYLSATILILTIVLRISSKILPIEFNTTRFWWVQNGFVWSLWIHIFISSFIRSFIKIGAERFGKGIFIKMLMGRYRNPKEEERIFMFLDLKDSTTIAEKLGHYKYSQFIQDCFFDLNEVLLDYEAEIYQYVGDEAVITWSYHRGLANNNCVALYFAFLQKLHERQEYYIEQYEVMPEFKAGVHGGALMVAEVGHIKKELAYHGDVINTSARIQAECKKHNTAILLSETLLKDLDLDGPHATKFLGDILLKGKRKNVKIHAILKLDET